jgi:hypothetical protein
MLQGEDDETFRRPKSQFHKTHRRTRALYGGSLRIRDPEHLLENADFVDAPSEIQAHNIRDVYASLARKKEFL